MVQMRDQRPIRQEVCTKVADCFNTVGRRRDDVTNGPFIKIDV